MAMLAVLDAHFSTLLSEKRSSCNLITFPNVSSGEQFMIVDPHSTLLPESIDINIYAERKDINFTSFFENRKILTHQARAAKHQVDYS